VPADLIRIDLDKCYGPFVERALEMLARCRDRGADYFVTYGYRSWAESDKLHALWLEGLGGRAAPGGFSAHNYGLAWDLTRDADTKKKGLQPTWDSKAYDVLGEEAKRAGLVWGASFNDKPHVQWPGYVSAKQLGPLRSLWRGLDGTEEERLREAWEYLDAGVA
jgi:peptidoglycan LD-endopeptidase CwlK